MHHSIDTSGRYLRDICTPDGPSPCLRYGCMGGLHARQRCSAVGELVGISEKVWGDRVPESFHVRRAGQVPFCYWRPHSLLSPFSTVSISSRTCGSSSTVSTPRLDVLSTVSRTWASSAVELEVKTNSRCSPTKFSYDLRVSEGRHTIAVCCACHGILDVPVLGQKVRKSTVGYESNLHGQSSRDMQTSLDGIPATLAVGRGSCESQLRASI